MKNYKHFGVWRIFKQSVFFGFLLLCPCCGGTAGDVPLFDTLDRRDSGFDHLAGILLRREDGSGKESGLVIRHDYHKYEPVVRRYDPRSKTIEIVSPEVWDKSTAPIARCDEQFPPFGFLEFNSKTGHLEDKNGDSVPTKGKHLLRNILSPQEKRVAILSASGISRKDFPTIIPFSGPAPGASGQYWHQVYSLETGQIESAAIRIPKPEWFSNFYPCWSADERFVVYYDNHFQFLSVVHTD